MLIKQNISTIFIWKFKNYAFFMFSSNIQQSSEFSFVLAYRTHAQLAMLSLTFRVKFLYYTVQRSVITKSVDIL